MLCCQQTSLNKGLYDATMNLLKSKQKLFEFVVFVIMLLLKRVVEQCKEHTL